MALDTNLVSYWKLDEQSGSRYDSTSNNNVLSSVNSVGYGTGADAKIINSADFVSASSQYLSIPGNSQTSLNSNIMSFSAWVKPTTLPTGPNSIITRMTTRGSYAFTIDGATDKLFFLYSSAIPGNDGTVTEASSSGTIPTGSWSYVTAVVDAAAKSILFYINGVLQTSTYGRTAGTSFAQDSIPFQIGTSASSEGYFDGFIDEVGIWGLPLTQANVTQLYNGGTGLTYPFGSGFHFSPFPSHYNT